MSGGRVLVIEDDENNMDVAQRIIRSAGHEALSATDGASGLAAARAERPDVILVDLLLPRVDGWTVTRTLRQEEWSKQIPIIAVSALAMQQDRARAIEAGCDDFVSKPYAPAELRAVLARFLDDVGAPARTLSRPLVPIRPVERLGSVLVVDDEPANVDLLVRRLQALGAETLRATDGESALAIADRELPDLILLDVMMPGIGGFETCRRLKINDRTAPIPVIFATALTDAEDLSKGFEAGGVDYITKPIDPTELAARVRSAIFTKRLQDELRGANAALRKAEGSRQELISMLGHDIRNLANSLVAFLQLVRLGQLDASQPEFAELLGLSESNVTELLRMVNALLDVYKMEEGRLEAEPRSLRLDDIVRKSIAQLTAEARARGVALECDAGETMVYVDETLMVRVFTNLLANAVKHTPSGGNARVEARPGENGWVAVQVCDSGPGIASVDAASVFDRFYQTAGGRSRGGSGLGLAFCKLAVELHGGKIRVANPGEAGAIIALTLPAPKAGE
jgi:CheY-like chemotaxis protein/anti-sigma regulatory factor (Ser/Thr protein kinase)